MTSAGIVKMTPEASDVPAHPPVCTMLFSRMPPPPSAFRTAMATTADGIAEAMVNPANRPRYEFAAARIAARMTASTMARTVNCGATFGAASDAAILVAEFIGASFRCSVVGDNLETHCGSRRRPRGADLKLGAQRVFEHAGQGLEEKGLFRHDARLDAMAAQGLCHDRTYRGDDRPCESGRYVLRRRDGEKALHLWSAGERDRIHLAGQDAFEKSQYRGVVGRVGV